MHTTITTTPITAGPGNKKRMASWSITIPPATRVVTPSALRNQCLLDADADASGVDDSYLGLLIDAATNAAEDAMQTSLVPRTMMATFYNGAPIDLPRGPVIEIIRVTDADDVEFTDYEIENVGFITRVVPWHAKYPISVVYRPGTTTDGTTPAVPADTTLGILTHAATLFANRESISDVSKTPIPHSLEMFYAAKRRDTGAA